MSNPLPLFVNAEQLHAAIGADDIQIVAVDAAEDFAGSHIPGALQLDMRDLMGTNPPVGGLLPADEELARLFSRIGLRNGAQIVAYDRAGDGQAARLLYTLDAMGHDAISLLDGGLAAWRAADFDLATGEPTRIASHFTVARQPDRIADRRWIETHLHDQDLTLLDVRSTDEYTGHDVRAARGGHIPGAVNIDWLRFKGRDGRRRPNTELESLLATHGIDADNQVVAYCQTHVRSSYVYLVLKALGYRRVRGYPGAWSQWGNAEDTPVETGDNDGA